MIHCVITWNPDPVMFHIGNMSIRWYSVLLGVGFFTGYLFARFIFKKEGVDRIVLESYGIWLLIGILVGGRLGHCLFYEFDYYIQHPLEIIKPWSGTLGKDAVFTGLSGFSSHGWTIGIILTLWLNSRIRKVPVLWALDIFAIVVVLAGAFVRIGNLMNSEIVGSPSELPWAFIFPRVDQIARHPAQIYESLAYLFTFILVFRYYTRKMRTVPNGTYLGWVMVGVFLSRFLIEFIKRDQVAYEAGMSINLGQYLSIPFILSGLFFIYRKALYGWLRNRKLKRES
jgi:prolipoprotein diacylglyceryl transferase